MYIRARKGIGYLPQEASIFRGPDGRAEHPGDPRDARSRWRRPAGQAAGTAGRTGPDAAREGARLHAVGRRAAARRDHARAGHLAEVHAARRAVRGHRPIAVTDIQKIIFHLKSRGIGVLITDHNVRETLRITDRAYIVHDGVIFKSGTPRPPGRGRGRETDLPRRRLPIGLKSKRPLDTNPWRFSRSSTPSSFRSSS